MSSAERDPGSRGRRWRTRIPVVVTTGVFALGVVAGCGSGGGSSGGSSGGSGGGDGAASHGQSLKIGAMFDISGPFGPIGTDQKAAYELALKHLGSNGAVKIDTVGEEDAQTSVDKAVQLARNFIAKGAQVILGPTSNAACQAVQQVTERAAVTAYCFTGGPLKPTPHLFSGEYAPGPGLGGAPLQFFKSHGWSKVACLRTADDSGQSYLTPLQQLAPKYEAKVVGVETFQPAAGDVTPQLAKLRATHPDVLYSCSSGTNLVSIVRGVVQLGWNIPVFAGLGSVQPSVVKAVKSYIPEGGLYSDGSWVVAPKETPKSFVGHDLVQQFVDQFSQATGRQPSIQAGSAWDAAHIMEAAAKNAVAAGQDVTGTTVAQQIEKLHNFPGVVDAYTFGPNRHRGTVSPPVIMQWTKDGTLKVAANVGK